MIFPLSQTTPDTAKVNFLASSNSRKKPLFQTNNRKGVKTWLRLLIVFSYLISLFCGLFSPTTFMVKAATLAVTPSLASITPTNASAPTSVVSSTQKTITHKGTLAGHTNPQQLLHLSISLKERDPQAETQYIQDLYNPNSPNYHHYLTPAQYGVQFGPALATRTQVADYLKSQGFKLTQNNTNGTLISFDGTVSQTEKTFQLTINNYTNLATNRTFYGNDRTPSLPTAISNSVVGVIEVV